MSFHWLLTAYMNETDNVSAKPLFSETFVFWSRSRSLVLSWTSAKKRLELLKQYKYDKG